MTDTDDMTLIHRAQGVSDTAGFADVFQDIADDIDGWWADGVPELDIDRRIDAWCTEVGFTARQFLDQSSGFEHLSDEQRDSLVKAIRFDEWVRENAKAIARTGRPLPFIYAIGDVFVDDKSLADQDEVVVWAVATRATNPEVVAKKFVRVCKQAFGSEVTKEQTPRVRRPGQMTPTEALAAHRSGMSYRDIALQNLRREHPDIIAHPRRFHVELRKERERLVDEVGAAERLWGKRLPDSPTDE